MQEEQNIFLEQDQFLNDFVDGLERKEKELQKKRRKRRRRKIWPGILLALAAVVLCGSILFHFGVLQSAERHISAFLTSNKAVVSGTVSASSENAETPEIETGNAGVVSNSGEPAESAGSAQNTAPQKIFAATLRLGQEILPENFETAAKSAIEDAAAKGLTTLFVTINNESGLFTDTENGSAQFLNVIKYANKKQISIFATLDIAKLSAQDFATQAAISAACQKVEALAKTEGLSGLMLTGYSRNLKGEDYSTYLKAGSLTGYKNYSEITVTNAVQAVTSAVRKSNPALCLGLICDSVYATADQLEGGLEAKAANQLLRDQNADVLTWAKNGYFDTVFVTVNTTTESTDLPFETLVKWWSEKIPSNCNIGYILSGTAAGEQKGNWKNPDQLVRQLKTLNNINRYVFCFDSYQALQNQNSEAISAALDYISGNYGNDYILSNLTFTAPTKTSFTTYENKVVFNGASDPKFKLTLNGKEIERTEYGYFTLEQELQRGNNTFTFSHKGSTQTYKITYRYVVLKEVLPTSAVKLDGGSTLVVKALARNGSKVTATLNGTTVQLSAGTEESQGSEFVNYTGSFALPDGYTKDTSLGKITFKGTHNGVTESATGGKVTVRKTELPSSVKNTDIAVTPTGGSYINVGSGYVAEVTKDQVETFTGTTVDDYSQPFNNYFPKGTVDYCSTKTVYDSESGGTYYKLRCGRRVYASNSKGNVKTYAATLPSTNNLTVQSCAVSGHHTVLKLKVDWKAPFLLEVLPQKYNSGDVNNRGKVSAVTFNYIDITFCYAGSFSSAEKIELSNNTLFSKAQVIKNSGDYTLRLYLKKTGAFYGWTADYDSSGNLVFKFLNPVQAQKANNKYGGTLNGIKIVVDAGHGGSDGGAVGANSKFDEADRSLLLAKKIETKLKSIGATVVMTRTADTSMAQDTRISKVRNALPDLAVSVHRNAALSSKANGYYSYYFNPYTVNPAQKITARMKNTGVYNNYNTGWHYFYLSRISACPVVLTENGFMSNTTDYQNMLDDNKQDKCADAIVQGIVDHFLAQ